MSEATLKPSREEHLGRLSRTAEEIRAQLAAFQNTLQRAGMSLPQGVMEGMKQLSSTLLLLQRGVEESEHERRNLQALAELGQVINSSLDLQTVLNEVIDTLIRLTGAERAFLMLRGETQQMEVMVARNWERESLEKSELEFSQTIIRRVLAQGEPVLTTNAQADPRFGGQESIVAYNLRSILCVPLKVKGNLTGVIYADNRVREGLFTTKERDLLTAFAHQAAIAIENARLFESVRRTLDEVTELKTLMEDVFASIASGVITADVDDIITLVNAAAASILATSRSSLLGASLTQLLPEIAPDLAEKIERVKEADERFIGLEAEPTLDSRGPVNLSLNLSPLKTAGDRTRGVAIVVDDLTEKKRLEAQRRLFERMVSPAVIDQLDPDSLQLGGRRAEVTTLFADLRGYTAFSENTDPEVLVTVLNHYLAAAAEAILQEEGTVDKFQGDAVMAWFNAPIPQPDHTLRALRAALAIRDVVHSIHAKMPPQLRLSFGMGIHVGEALLGLVGSQRRLDYTAIGDSINTAKRLQENAEQGQILVSAEAVARVREWIVADELPPIQVEGKEQPIKVYALRGLRPSSASS